MQRFIMSKEYLEELSQRIREYRISADMTQQELADASGISLRTIQNYENHKDIKLDCFIKILMALGLDGNIFALVPDINRSPVVLLEESRQKKRQRVRKKKAKEQNSFKWGDEK